MKKYRFATPLAAAVVLVLLTPQPSHAVDRCTAWINPWNGVVEVFAKYIDDDTFRWGVEAGAEFNEFDNPECMRGHRARGCRLAPRDTLEARTPPSDCTLYVADAAGSCSTWIRGCVPGVRTLPEVQPTDVPTGTPSLGTLVCDEQRIQSFVSSGATVDFNVACPSPGQAVSGRAETASPSWSVVVSQPVDGATWHCAIRNPTLVAGFARCYARCCQVQ